jgi:hypothetical protein
MMEWSVTVYLSQCTLPIELNKVRLHKLVIHPLKHRKKKTTLPIPIFDFICGTLSRDCHLPLLALFEKWSLLLRT